MDVKTNIRSANCRAILRLIRQSEAISRVQLAQRLKLSKSTVTENVALLMKRGIVQETGMGASQVSGGRRPVMLRINGGYRYLVAAELGLHQPIFALADLNGKFLQRRKVFIPDEAPYLVRLRITQEAIRQLIREAGVADKTPAVIALSSPGAYRASKREFVLNPEFANWSVDQLIKDLERIFSTEVFRVNDLNAAAMGEYHHGAGHNVRSMVFLSCGMGVGMGMVLDGRLYGGAAGSAGEIAQSRLAGGRPLRALVEINALLDRIRREAPPATVAAFNAPIDKLDFEGVVRLWQEQDRFTRACVRDLAQHLGEMAAFSISLLNCELMVFGGDYLVFEDQMLPIINKVVQQESFDPVRVVSSELRESAGLQGLTSMALDVLLDRIAAGQA